MKKDKGTKFNLLKMEYNLIFLKLAQIGHANTTQVVFVNGKKALVYYTSRAVKTTVHAKRELSVIQISRNTVMQNDFLIIICNTVRSGVLYYVVPTHEVLEKLQEKQTIRIYPPATSKPVYNNRKSEIPWDCYRDAWNLITT